MTKKEYEALIKAQADQYIKNHPERFMIVTKNYIIDRGYDNEPLENLDEINANRADRDLSKAYYIRGQLYAEKGKIAKAVADFTEAIRLNPNADAYHHRGLVYADTGDTAKAIADFTEALRLDPYDAEMYYYSRGALYQKIGDIAMAIADYTEARSEAARKAKEAMASITDNRNED